MAQNYVMANLPAGPEYERLGLIERWLDGGTTRRLERLGVAPGWRCLEVGAGRGSITRWLGERVGAKGSVVAADIDPRFLTGLPAQVEVRRVDVRAQELGSGEFDLAHCRLLLMHMPDPEAVLARMVAALRPGGVLLVEEGDHGLLHFDGHPAAPALNQAADVALHAMQRAGVMRPWFGRRLPAMLGSLPLKDRAAETETRVGTPGAPDYEWTAATYISGGPRFIQVGANPDWLEVCQAFFGQPGTVASTMSLVAAWGMKV
jgi:SAM-dependent methyltransferase